MENNVGFIVIIVVILAVLVGIPVVISGKIAKKKGYSLVLGALLGFFLSIAGLIIVLILPDKKEISFQEPKK